MPGFHVSVLARLWAPKGTPKDVDRQAQRRGAGGAGRSGGAAAAHRRRPGDPAARAADAGGAGAYQKAEIEKWWPIIKAAGIKAQ